MMYDVMAVAMLPLMLGWLFDRILGDPVCLPHPVVFFGRTISFFERRLNTGTHRKLKGGITAAGLVLAVYAVSALLLMQLSHYVWIWFAVEVILVFYCLAGQTLRDEVRMVFDAADRSAEEGRRQVSRIVGRDTASLSGQEVRTAALETSAENLSDGVVAPVFWYLLLGVPGMMAYKMVNTLDSMTGYRTARYREYGCVAARIDDVANWIPARLTAFLMVMAAGRPRLLKFVRRYGRCHASPNSGYPEAALAGILGCRFGGPHDYFGETVSKPYIGCDQRNLTREDMLVAVTVNLRVEIISVVLASVMRGVAIMLLWR